MNFFERLFEELKNKNDEKISRLVLGWHASFILSENGRCGIGFVPDSLKEPHTARAVHTEELIKSSIIEIAKLYVSPFPQEFAAATAACSALFPFNENSGLPLDLVMTCARSDKVAVLGYERDLLPFMRDWGWRIAVFDDRCVGRPDCFSQEDFSRGVLEAEWVWLSPEAIRDRWLLSTQDMLKEKKGCFLQGPGLPAIPGIFLSLGITHIVVPSGIFNNSSEIEAHVSAGGSPWLCENLIWRVYQDFS